MEFDHNITRVKIPCRNLNDLLEQNGLSDIDYMSVDTEGSELEVLGDLKWELYHPTVVQVEVRRLYKKGVAQPYSVKEVGLRKLMGANGYHVERVFSSGFVPQAWHASIEKAHDLIFVRSM